MIFKKLIITFCLLLFAGVLYAAEDLHSITGVKAGFSDTSTGTKPESTPLKKLGYNGAIGFPYNNREFGIELPSLTVVNKLVLEMELRCKESEMSRFGLDKSIKLYASKDNIIFHQIKSCEVNLIPFKRNSKNWIKIVIADMSVYAKFLKLCTRKGIKGYAGLAQNPQNAFSIYKAKQLLKLKSFRFMTDKFKITAEVNIKNYSDTPQVTICLKIKDKWHSTATKKLTANGRFSLKIAEALPNNLPIGKYSFKLNLVNKAGHIVDTLNSSFYHVKKIVDNVPNPGEVAIFNPTKTGILKGRWTVEKVQSKFEKPIKYVTSNGSECIYSLHLPGSSDYAVYVGLIGGSSVANVRINSKAETIRLKTWRKKSLSNTVAGEVFIGIHKGGNTLMIASTGKPLNLSHVRLQGLTAKQQQLFDSKAVIVPRIIIHSDGFSGFYSGRMKTKAELVKFATIYKNRPLYSFDWGLGTSTAFNIKTRRGVLFGEGKTEFWRQGDKMASQIVNNLYKHGINPLQVIAEHLNSEKIHVNATLRLNATYPPRIAASHNGPFLMENPQFRIINAQGKRSWQLSYAHPEVRDFMVSVLEDAIACGVDGVHLQFLRHPPFFGIDKPLIAEYKKRYGDFDPKKDYMNKKWQKLQCEVMTKFIKKIRQMLDAQGLKHNKKLTLSASFDFKDYYSQGLDVATWIKSAWVSVISPGYYGVGGQTFDLKPFVKMSQGTSCKIFPNLEMTLLGSDPTPDSETGKVIITRESVSLDYGRKLFLEFYNQGAYGMYPFNGGSQLIAAVANMKELKIWEEFEQPVIDWFNETEQ
jgi:Glycosyl hydrolase-like 10